MVESALSNQESLIAADSLFSTKHQPLKLIRKEKLEEKRTAHIMSHMPHGLPNTEAVEVNPEGDSEEEESDQEIKRLFYESQKRPQTEDEKRIEAEREAERLKK